MLRLGRCCVFLRLFELIGSTHTPLKMIMMFDNSSGSLNQFGLSPFGSVKRKANDMKTDNICCHAVEVRAYFL